jgi:hypothetical protein
MMVEFEPPPVACVVGADQSFAVLRETEECVIVAPVLELARKEQGTTLFWKNLNLQVGDIRIKRLDCARIRPGPDLEPDPNYDRHVAHLTGPTSSDRKRTR